MQADLAWYRELKTRSEQAERDLGKAREKLLLGLPDGVESGAFRLKADERESRPFSYDAVVDIVGREAADEMKRQLPVRTSMVLTVTGPWAYGSN